MNKAIENKTIRILLVEDSKADAEAVKRYLKDQPSHSIQHVETAAQAEEALSEKLVPDLVLLDLGLPDDDGLNLLTKIRETANIPVIIVSINDYVVDRIIGLEMGADDYVTKPYEARELQARIKAVLRRTRAITTPDEPIDQSHEKVNFDGWVLDKSRYALYNQDGISAELTVSEFRILEVLTKTPQRVLSRDHLYNIVYDAEYGPHDRAIDIMIGRIRKKLSDDLDNPKYIKTVRGVGYMFCANTETRKKIA